MVDDKLRKKLIKEKKGLIIEKYIKLLGIMEQVLEARRELEKFKKECAEK